MKDLECENILPTKKFPHRHNQRLQERYYKIGNLLYCNLNSKTFFKNDNNLNHQKELKIHKKKSVSGLAVKLPVFHKKILWHQTKGFSE